jgi:hypothetical protein
MMIWLYFDICCLCRRFDDTSQLAIVREFAAISEIQQMILSGELCLVWSYVLNDENARNSDLRRRAEVSSWSRHAVMFVPESVPVDRRSLEIQATGIKESKIGGSPRRIVSDTTAGAKKILYMSPVQ